MELAHAPISRLETALSEGELTLAQVKAILRPRAKRDSGPGRRAKSWLAAHKTTTPARVENTTPAKQTGPGSRGGDPQKYARGVFATAQGHDANTPAWWEAYKSAEAKAFASTVTTHEEARERIVEILAAS